MKVSSIHIRKFRGIKELDVEFGDVTVLIGENNSGKTSVLDALRICLLELKPGRRRVFDPLDFHLSDERAEPSSADPIEIEIRFSEQCQGEWGEELKERFEPFRIARPDERGRHHVRLRVRCMYDDNREYIHDWSFLEPLGSRIDLADNDGALITLQEEIPFFYLTALRDAGRHFDAQGRFWRPFLQKSELSEERKAEIEKRSQELNELVVSSHTSFERVHAELRRLQDVVPLSARDVVSIEAVPGRMFEMLTRAEVQLAAPTGAKIPLHRHGEGTQSLAVVMLLSAFLEAHTKHSPLITLEEPEAHLHPSAVRAFWNLILSLPGQKVIATHSGDLLAEIDPQSIRRLARAGTGIRCFQISEELPDSIKRAFDIHVRHYRPELLFARCWLLVEGQSEAIVYPAAARALNHNLHREGIQVVIYQSVGIEMLTSIANELGIAWYCVGDDDDNRAHVERKVALMDDSWMSSRVTFPYVDLERHLMDGGYNDLYRSVMQDPAMKIGGRAKTTVATRVAAAMEERGELGATPELRSVIMAAVDLARGIR